jgi:hypothetical protein
MYPRERPIDVLRARLDLRTLERRGGGPFGANPLTVSIGVVTINLQCLGFLSPNEEEMLEVAELVRGCVSWAVQRFVASKAVDTRVLDMSPPSAEQMERLRVEAEALGLHCVIR